MYKIYLVYIIDEAEDLYAVDSAFINKSNAEEYAEHHNNIAKSFKQTQKHAVREMELHDALKEKAYLYREP